MKEVGYSNLSIVLETWDQARFGDKNFDTEFGMVAVARLFVLQPRAKQVFGFDKGDAYGWEHAAIHGKAFAGFFDSIFQMLGPDLEFIEEILEQLGKRHKKMGVNPSFFPFMGQAVIYSLEQYLKKELTKEQREAWEIVFEGISDEIVKQILAD
mmetsp:Transcript_1052/g.1393  ORF Transcript_1052/g.1393 Transcript_1052/m.1393 type:complete len:154 (+) Transcript_1052:193-654(+)